MITARDILEIYDLRKKSMQSGTFEIFRTPLNAQDFQDAKNSCGQDEVRFIAYAPTKQVWIWGADHAIHSVVSETIPKIKQDIGIYGMIWGIAKQVGSKWVMTRWDILIDMLEDVPRSVEDRKSVV